MYNRLIGDGFLSFYDDIYILLKYNTSENSPSKIPTKLNITYKGVSKDIPFSRYTDKDPFLKSELMLFKLSYKSFDGDINQDFKQLANDLEARSVQTIGFKLSDFVTPYKYEKGKVLTFRFKIPPLVPHNSNSYYDEIKFVISDIVDTSGTAHIGWSLYDRNDRTINDSDSEFLLKGFDFSKDTDDNTYSLSFYTYMKSEQDVMNKIPYNICLYEDSTISIGDITLSMNALKGMIYDVGLDSIINVNTKIENFYTICNSRSIVNLGIFGGIADKPEYENVAYQTSSPSYGGRIFGTRLRPTSEMISIYNYLVNNQGSICTMTIRI